MKTFSINTVISAILMAGILSCASETSVETSSGALKTFSSFNVDIEECPITKVHLENGGKIKWDLYDGLGIYSDTDAVQPFYYNSGGVLYSNTPVNGTEFYAYYPYSNGITIDSENPKHLKVDLTRFSTSHPDQYWNIPMVAKSKGNYLSFKHTAGVLHLAIKGTKPLSMVSISGNNNEELWGTPENCYIDMDEDVPVIKFKEYQKGYTNISLWGYVQLTEDTTYDVFFVLPPMTFDKGFTLSLMCNGQNHTKTTNKRVTIERGVIKHFTVVDIDEVIQEEQNSLLEEREALVAIYNALDGPNWKRRDNWCSDRPLNEWNGVMTDYTGHVYYLDIEQNGLNGAIPKEITKLSALKTLKIEESNGVITDYSPIFDLTSLESLSFGIGDYWTEYNEIKKHMFALPEDIANLNNLKILTVSGVNSDLPEALFGMENLEHIYLKYFNPGQPMQTGFGRLKNLKALSIRSVCEDSVPGANALCGELPDDLFDLHNLEMLEIVDTRVGGELSPRIGELQNLYSLSLPHNKFNGPLPAELANLHLWDNSYDGQSKLCINLCENDFSGKIPEAFRNWPEWQLNWGYIFEGNDKLDLSEVAPLIPEFSATALDGSTFSSASVKDNELTVLLQMACWDAFSIGVIEELKDLYSSYKDKGLGVVSYSSYVEPSSLASFASQYSIPWQVFINSEDGLSNSIGAELYPHGRSPSISIFDDSGRLVYYYFGAPKDLTSFIEGKLGPAAHGSYESTDFSADGTVHTIQTATRGAGIDVVLMGDAYSDRLIADGTYGTVMQRAADALFSEEPYKSFRDCFNVYYVDVVSKNEKYSGETSIGTWFGEGTVVGGDDTKVFEYARKAISADRIDDALILVMINRDFYAGTCYMYSAEDDTYDYGRGATISYFPASSVESSFVGLVNHEAGGHGFAKLGDEYYYPSNGRISQSEIDGYLSKYPYGWWKNVDFTSDPSEVKWSGFISDSRYAGERLGVYEGACTYLYGAYRPTRNSIMNNNTGGYNAPSRYAIWYRINKLAFGAGWNGTYEDFVAYDAVNRTPAAAAARRAAARRSAGDKDFTPLAPPVVIEGGWRQ